MSSDFECCEHTKLKLFVTKFLAGVHCISYPSWERFIPSLGYLADREECNPFAGVARRLLSVFIRNDSSFCFEFRNIYKGNYPIC